MRVTVIAGLALFGVLGTEASAQNVRTANEKVLAKLRENELRELVLTSPAEARIHVDVMFQTQPDLEAVKSAVAHLDRVERRRALKGYAQAICDSEQGPCRELLRQREALGQADHITSLWIINVIGVETTPDVILEMAALPEVDYIHHDPERNVLLSSSGTPPTPTCDQQTIDSPFAWNQMNIKGQGVVVAMLDTGVCWTHSDLANNIWVNPGEDLGGDGIVFDTNDLNGVDDDNNGFVDDLIGWSFDHLDVDPRDPTDFNSHGTHTAGTVAGDGTGGTQIGVAPRCKIMPVRDSAQIAWEVEVWDSMQYAADNGADIISMSLGWLQAWSPDRPVWRTNCINTQAMGTMMVIAAGNEGSCCAPVDSVRTPGDVPEVTTVGATDCNDNLAGFSSLGPVEWANVAPWFDHPFPPGLIKPNVSAPGVSTISASAFPCDGYRALSGTSMATPHVAGAAALLRGVRPDLSIDEVRTALETTALDLGSAGPDNAFGSGRIDVRALLQAYAPLRANVYSLSAAVGGTVDLTLESPTHAGDDYWVLASASGNEPGMTFAIGVNVPLNFDLVLLLSITSANSAAFVNTRGTLDGAGMASATINTGGPLPPDAVGAVISLSYITFTGGAISSASNPVNISIGS